MMWHFGLVALRAGYEAWRFQFPIGTALIAASLRLDADTRIAALCFAVGDALPHPIEEVASRYGEGVAQLVDGLRRLNGLRVIDISNNLGDSKSLITHPATTTHRAMGPEGRAAVGLTDGVVRLSVGLEDTADLLADLKRALG